MDTITFDEGLIKHVGQCGWGQLRIVLLTSLFQVANALAFMVPVFLFKDPLASRSWECVEDSLVSRFGLVCGEAWKVQLTNSLFFMGAFAGSGIFGLLCDRCGRKVPLLLATGFVAASMFGLLGATSYWAVAGLRLLCGIGAAGSSHCCFLLVTECVGPDSRGRVAVGSLLFFVFGEFLLIALAVGLPAWGHLALVAGAINIAAMLLYPFIPESARWLLSQGKQQQATELLQAIAAANGGHMPQQPLVCSKDTNCSKDTATICSYSNSDVPDSSGKPADGSSSDGQARLGLLSLLQNRSLFIRSAVLFVTWYALMQVYAGISLGAGNLPGSLYAAFAMGTAAEMVAVLVALPLVDRVGRHTVISMGLLLGGGACLACANVPGTAVVAVLAAIGKFGCSASMSVIPIYTAELFPTSVRSTAMGICSQAARLGAIAAPFMLMLGSQLHIGSLVFLPYLVFGSMSCLAGLLVLLLPETLGAAMPESMADLEQLQSFFAAKPWHHGCMGILAFIFRSRAATAGRPATTAQAKTAADSMPVIVVTSYWSEDAQARDSCEVGSGGQCNALSKLVAADGCSEVNVSVNIECADSEKQPCDVLSSTLV